MTTSQDDDADKQGIQRDGKQTKPPKKHMPSMQVELLFSSDASQRTGVLPPLWCVILFFHLTQSLLYSSVA